ncbi:helix-turn-helix transcriptional regulator [Jeotgalibaca dankookensis]|uniref:helix-turn-helix transcriptional regulator n=1 Tax=Jeotgalibaca dankookensis TaxID=708126 RepID=UPI001F31500D|nr:helix-turn-helix domain-containing protein [Jeotgalibaca dankookensis]
MTDIMKINKVAGYRNMLGMTQKEMAVFLGITAQSYSNKETGKNPFNDKEKIKLKKLFNRIDGRLSIDDIFFDLEF